MKIVEANVNDVSKIQKLLRDTWADTYGEHLSQATLDEVYKNWQSIQFLTKQVNNPEMYFPLVKYEDEIVGIATARINNDVISLFRLYVYPEHQRKGIGEALIGNVIAHYPVANKIQLHVEEINQRGQSFYEKHGFKEIKREEEKVINEVINQILMEKEL